MRDNLGGLRRKKKRLIVGLDGGGTSGTMAAAVVEVAGNGDDTVLRLIGFSTIPIDRELAAALGALERRERFDSEEIAGINFLVLNSFNRLYEEALQSAEAESHAIDIVGLKCLEIGEHVFPSDPKLLSEMTNHAVASRFRIGSGDGSGRSLDVREHLLEGIVKEMVDRLTLEEQVREAVTVALLANEALFGGEIAERGKASRKTSRKSVSSPSHSKQKKDKSRLCGEFFFPR